MNLTQQLNYWQNKLHLSRWKIILLEWPAEEFEIIKKKGLDGLSIIQTEINTVQIVLLDSLDEVQKEETLVHELMHVLNDGIENTIVDNVEDEVYKGFHANLDLVSKILVSLRREKGNV